MLALRQRPQSRSQIGEIETLIIENRLRAVLIHSTAHIFKQALAPQRHSLHPHMAGDDPAKIDIRTHA